MRNPNFSFDWLIASTDGRWPSRVRPSYPVALSSARAPRGLTVSSRIHRPSNQSTANQYPDLGFYSRICNGRSDEFFPSDPGRFQSCWQVFSSVQPAPKCGLSSGSVMRPATSACSSSRWVSVIAITRFLRRPCGIDAIRSVLRRAYVTKWILLVRPPRRSAVGPSAYNPAHVEHSHDCARTRDAIGRRQRTGAPILQ
jgi:hypothetical protein